MRLMLAYDRDGNIIKVVEVWSLPKGIPHPFADLTEAQRVLAIEDPEGELREADLSEIPHRFRINTTTEKLIRRRAR